MGDRDPGVGRGGDSGGYARHDLELDPRRAQRLALLAAAAEDEGVAALEPDDPLAGSCGLDQSARRSPPVGPRAARAPCRRRRARRPRGRRRARREGSAGHGRSRRRRRSAPASAPSSARGLRARPRPGRRPRPAPSPDLPVPRAHASSARSRISRAPVASRRWASSAPSRVGSVPSPSIRSRIHSLPSGEADEGLDPHDAGLGSRSAARPRAGCCRWRQQRDDGALGGQLAQRGPVGERLDDRGQGSLVARAGLQQQRALAGRRRHRLVRQREGASASRPSRRRPATASTIAVEVLLGELAQAGVDVAVQLAHPRSGRAASSWALRRRLAVPTRAPSGTSSRPEPAPTQTSAGSFRAGTAASVSPSVELGRHVLRRMHADVGLSVEQRPLDPAHEARLVADIGSVGGDLDQLRPTQHLRDLLGLCESEGTAPRGDSKRSR